MSKTKKETEETVSKEQTTLENEASADTQPDEIETLVAQNAELNERVLRQMAEFDNFKKRTQKEKEEMSVYLKGNCVKEFLEVLDNFERGLAVECKDEEYKKGMEMIFSQFNQTLQKLDVAEIPALNETFNPDFHNAINQVEDESFGENTVCQVMQKGYKIGDKVIRHSMVVVANP